MNMKKVSDISGRAVLERIQRDLLPALERKIYRENIKSIMVVKKDGTVAAYFVYDKDQDIKWWFLERLGKIEPCNNVLDMKNLPLEEVYTTDFFWTCECEHYFIHHMVQERCPICKLNRTEDTQLLRTI